MTKIAVISDIHGDIDSLRAALTKICELEADFIVCLGDVVDSDVDNEPIVQLLMENGVICVKGNHEDLERLPDSEVLSSFKQRCRDSFTLDNYHFCHVVNRVPELSIYNGCEAWNIMCENPWDIVFVGHNHTPRLYVYDPNRAGEATTIEYNTMAKFKISEETKAVVSVGSVIPNRSYYDPRRTFVMFDPHEREIQFVTF